MEREWLAESLINKVQRYRNEIFKIGGAFCNQERFGKDLLFTFYRIQLFSADRLLLSAEMAKCNPTSLLLLILILMDIPLECGSRISQIKMLNK